MLIICTRDIRVVRAHYTNTQWGTVNIIADDFKQKGANSAFFAKLSSLQPQEPLCILAHGNDYNIGDVGYSSSGWDWGVANIASYFHLTNAVNDWMEWPSESGEIAQVLFQTCCESEDNFASGCALELYKQANFDYAIDCYGYSVSVPIDAPIPAPNQLAGNAALSRVRSRRQF